MCRRIAAAAVAAIAGSTTAAVTSSDARATDKPPAAVLQYVEAVPTSEGKHPTGYVGVDRKKKLTARERRAIATQNAGVAKALSEVARSTAFGAPQSALASAREAPVRSGDVSSLSATATIDGSSSSTLLVLVIALAAGTALAGAFALLRRRNARV
jgi:hypothetical protein